MKQKITTLTVLLSIAVTVACTKIKDDPKTVVKGNFETELKKGLDDPKSYEFVEISDFDTVLTKTTIEEEILSRRTYLDGIKSELNLANNLSKESYANLSPSLFMPIDSLKASINSYEKEIDSLGKLLAKTKSTEIDRFDTIISFRANNKFGAKVLNEYLVRVRPDFSIISYRSTR